MLRVTIGLFVVMMVMLTSCSKKLDKNGTKTGFYYEGQGQSDLSTSYSLFIDGVDEGKLKQSPSEPACGSADLLYVTLNKKEHEVLIKNANNQVVGSYSIKITSGSSHISSGKTPVTVQNGPGIRCSSANGNDCAIVALFN